MQRWEYREYAHLDWRRLEQLGLEGWELVLGNYHWDHTGETDHMWVSAAILKRRLNEEWHA